MDESITITLSGEEVKALREMLQWVDNYAGEYVSPEWNRHVPDVYAVYHKLVGLVTVRDVVTA